MVLAYRSQLQDFALHASAHNDTSVSHARDTMVYHRTKPLAAIPVPVIR